MNTPRSIINWEGESEQFGYFPEIGMRISIFRNTMESDGEI